MLQNLELKTCRTSFLYDQKNYELSMRMNSYNKISFVLNSVYIVKQ
jgi:hypothetical protein